MTLVQPTITRRSCPEIAVLHPHPVVHRVLAARGVQPDDPVDHRLRDLLNPNDLNGLDVACALLADAVRRQRRITVIGDYDTDGATSTTLAISALNACGTQCVDFLIPNRFDMGYGLGPTLVDIAAERGSELLLTVDNGISSIDGVVQAKARGLDVVITDHHLPGEQLPAADAIVNPNLADDLFPSKNLAGVGVIFYVMAALCRSLERSGWF